MALVKQPTEAITVPGTVAQGTGWGYQSLGSSMAWSGLGPALWASAFPGRRAGVVSRKGPGVGRGSWDRAGWPPPALTLCPQAAQVPALLQAAQEHQQPRQEQVGLEWPPRQCLPRAAPAHGQLGLRGPSQVALWPSRLLSSPAYPSLCVQASVGSQAPSSLHPSPAQWAASPLGFCRVSPGPFLHPTLFQL